MYKDLLENLFSTEEGSVAIACPDDQIEILKGFAEYVNTQPGYKAEMENDILKISRLL